MRFKAAILVELGKPLVVDELEVPKLGVGQVLVRVMASGICGAQLGEISGAKGDDPWLPHLLGHEGGGIVLETGPGVKTVKPDDHVVMHWRKGSGIESESPKYKWTGARNTFYGGFAGGGWVTTFNEVAVISENRLTKIDPLVAHEIAALFGCAVTTALGLINNEAKLKIGESIAIAGVGGVGLNVVQGADLVGAHPIIAIDKQPVKLDMANDYGVTHTILTLDGDYQIANGVDVFVDCTGDPMVIAKGYDLIKPNGGRLILVGQPHCGCDLILPGFRNQYCGKVVMDSQGGLTSPDVDIPRYVELYLAGKLCLDDLITHRFPLEKVNDAIEVVESGEAGRCVLMMD